MREFKYVDDESSFKNIYLNASDFENGKSNILFITGISHSGKTTFAKNFSLYKDKRRNKKKIYKRIIRRIKIGYMEHQYSI